MSAVIIKQYKACELCNLPIREKQGWLDACPLENGEICGLTYVHSFCWLQYHIQDQDPNQEDLYQEPFDQRLAYMNFEHTSTNCQALINNYQEPIEVKMTCIGCEQNQQGDNHEYWLKTCPICQDDRIGLFQMIDVSCWMTYHLKHCPVLSELIKNEPYYISKELTFETITKEFKTRLEQADSFLLMENEYEES